ncbi:MAG: hypothetical protein ACFFD2_28485, partial [Promethearchaeota archaeon]
MFSLNDTKPEKLTKREKQEREKLEKASERMEKELEEKNYLKISIFSIALINLLIFAVIPLLTSNLFSIGLIYGYAIIVTLISIVPVMITEYERVGRKPPKIVLAFNSLLKKVFPFDRKQFKLGPSVMIIFIYLFSVGGFIAIFLLTFVDVIAGNPGFYSYLISPGDEVEYGFFSFVANSSSNSLMPSILWYLIIGIPVI